MPRIRITGANYHVLDILLIKGRSRRGHLFAIYSLLCMAMAFAIFFSVHLLDQILADTLRLGVSTVPWLCKDEREDMEGGFMIIRDCDLDSN